jgi:DNA-binding NarL/FixJ family response regulator
MDLEEVKSEPQTVISVLVVDHKPPLLNAIVRMLRQTGGIHVLDAVLRPMQAVQETYEYAPDVVLYGYDSRDAHCLDLLTQLRSKLPSTYIIASSFDFDQPLDAPAIAAGADDYVPGNKLDTDLVPKVLHHERKRR